MPVCLLHLYTFLLGSLDTESHSKGNLAVLGRRYLHDNSISLTSYPEGKDGFHPYLEISWTALDNGLDEGYDLIRELLFETRISDSDEIGKIIETIQTDYRYDMSDNIETIMTERAFGRESKRIRYDSFVSGLEYYDFLTRTRKLLQDDPAAVTAKLKSMQDILNNRTNAVAIFAGNESSITLNRSLAEQFFDSLNARDTERAEYDLPVPEKNEALIIDSSVQYNMQNISYKEMGYDDYEGWMTVAAHMVNDFYLTPILRDKYGVYDPYCANNNSGGAEAYTFSPMTIPTLPRHSK